MPLLVAIAAADYCCIATGRDETAADGDAAAIAAQAARHVWAHPRLPLLVGIASATGDVDLHAQLDRTLGRVTRVPQTQAQLVEIVGPASAAWTLLAVGTESGVPMFGVVQAAPSASDPHAFDVQSHFSRRPNSAVLHCPESAKGTPEHSATVRLCKQPRGRVRDVLGAFFETARAAGAPGASPPRGDGWDLTIRPLGLYLVGAGETSR